MKGGGNGAATTTTALLVVLVAASPVQTDAAVAAVRRLGAGGDAPAPGNGFQGRVVMSSAPENVFSNLTENYFMPK